MAVIQEGVYWCARDLAGIAVVGNHHFILLVTSQSRFRELPFAPNTENDIFFCTLGGFKLSDNRVRFDDNEASDVQSVREYIDPGEHVSSLTPDLDLEPHKVTPPTGSAFDFMKQVAKLAQNYEANTTAIAPIYTLIDKNCSAWINTLFAVAGVSASDRETYGEFFGIDWGEEDMLDEALFAA